MILSLTLVIDNLFSIIYISGMNQKTMNQKVSTSKNSSSEQGESVSLSEVMPILKKHLKQIQTFKEIGVKNTNIISSQDAYCKQLAQKNQKALDAYLESPPKSMEQRLNDLSTILFTNFEISNANVALVKAYIDEFYERFITLEKSVTGIITHLDKLQRLKTKNRNR